MAYIDNVPSEVDREFVVRMPEEGWFEAQPGHVAGDYANVTLHVVPSGGHEFEFYVYPWDQKNCIMAMELDSIDEQFEVPEGITVVGEITHDPEFKNVSFAKGQPAGGLIGLYSVTHEDFLPVTLDDLKSKVKASRERPDLSEERSDLSERISAVDLRADFAQQEREESDEPIRPIKPTRPIKLIISADVSPNGEETVIDFSPKAFDYDSYGHAYKDPFLTPVLKETDSYEHAYKNPFLTPTLKETPLVPRFKGRSITSNNGGKSMIDVDFPTGSDSAGGDFSR